jgi:hypothetical protein
MLLPQDLAEKKGAEFDAAPLVDLLISLSMRQSPVHRHLATLLMRNFTGLFQTEHVEQIVEVCLFGFP